MHIKFRIWGLGFCKVYSAQGLVPGSKPIEGLASSAWGFVSGALDLGFGGLKVQAQIHWVPCNAV